MAGDEMKAFKGSITGEIFYRKATLKGAPRRKLKDGRTETGLSLDEAVDEPTTITKEISFEIPDESDTEEGLLMPEPISVDEVVELNELSDNSAVELKETPEPSTAVRTAQAPKTTKKDVTKLEALQRALITIAQPEEVSVEERMAIGMELWNNAFDVRIETQQHVISQTQWTMMAGMASIGLMMQPKIAKVRKSKGQQTNIDDVFGDEE